MAVVNVKSTAVTNADNTNPQTLNKQNVDGGRMRERVGVAEVTNGDSIASTFRLMRVKSSDRVSRVLLSSDAITGAIADVGLYDIAGVNSGAVVDADLFASAVSLATAQVHTDVTHEADPAGAGSGYGVEDVEKQIWQLLGLTADPGKSYDVALTLTAAATATGTAGLKVIYNDGN